MIFNHPKIYLVSTLIAAATVAVSYVTVSKEKSLAQEKQAIIYQQDLKKLQEQLAVEKTSKNNEVSVKSAKAVPVYSEEANLVDPGDDQGPQEDVSYPANGSSIYSGSGSGLLRVREHLRELKSENYSLKEKAGLLSKMLAAKEREAARISGENQGLKENLDKSIASLARLTLLQKSMEQKYKQDMQFVSALIRKKNSQLSKLSAEKLGLEYQLAELKNHQPASSNISPSVVQQDAGLSDFENDFTLSDESTGNNDREGLLTIKGLDGKYSSGEDERIEQLNSRISQLNDSFESIRSAIEHLSQDVARKELMDAGRNEEISGVKSRLDKVNTENHILAGELEAKENRINALRSKLFEFKDQASLEEDKLESQTAADPQPYGQQQY